MLNSNSKIKKSVILALMSFLVLPFALNFGCCLCNSAVAVRDTVAEPEDDFLFWGTYAYSDPPGENEQPEETNPQNNDNERNIQTLLTAVGIFGEIARLPHDQQGEVIRNVSPLDIYTASRMIADDDCNIC